MRIYKLIFDLESEKSQDLLETSSFGRLNNCYFRFVIYNFELNEMECIWLFKIFFLSECKEFAE